MPPPAFHLTRPAPADAVPVLFDSPHSGMEWPGDFQPAASRAAILTTWDAYVDRLWSGVPAAGGTLLAATFPRAYIDANRAADDIDPALLASPWPTPLSASDYSRRGMGLIRRLALPGQPMYARPLTVEEVRRRIDDYYLPYRRALSAELEALHSRHGSVWHVNCHSMKSRGNEMNTDAGAPRPDFVVSDRQGLTAAPEFTAWVASWFTARGHTVQVNEPYRGGDLVATFGRPAVHRHSVQIEINRALYLDEAAVQPSPGFAPLQATLADFARALTAHVRTQF